MNPWLLLSLTCVAIVLALWIPRQMALNHAGLFGALKDSCRIDPGGWRDI